MFFARKILTSAFLPLILAQYGAPVGGKGPSTSSSSIAAASASTTVSSISGIQTVVVGANGGLTFSPNSITAKVGSSIEFDFSTSPRHSVVEGTFASPCVPVNDSAFYSGLQTTSANAFTLVVNDTNPIYFFCGFPSHCSLGMVGVINPPSDGSQTVAEYSAAAAKVSNAPAISLPVQGGSLGPIKAVSSGSSSSSASAAATSSTPMGSAATRGMDTSGSAQWIAIGLTGMFAPGMGALLM